MDLVWIGIALFIIGAAWFVFAPGATKPASRNKKSKKKKEPSSQKKPHRHTARKQQGAEEDFSDELEEEFPAEVEAGFPAGFEAVSEESLKHHPNSAISSHLSSSTAMSSNTVSAKTVSANPPSGVGNASEPVSEPTTHSAANLGAENERVLPNDTMMDEPVFKEPETGGPMLDEPMLDELMVDEPVHNVPVSSERSHYESQPDLRQPDLEQPERNDLWITPVSQLTRTQLEMLLKAYFENEGTGYEPDHRKHEEPVN